MCVHALVVNSGRSASLDSTLDLVEALDTVASLVSDDDVRWSLQVLAGKFRSELACVDDADVVEVIERALGLGREAAHE